MKSFWEKVKDILYDSTDYIVMILVIAVVALVINWKIGGLLGKDSIYALGQTPPSIEENDKEVSENEESDADRDNVDQNGEGNIDGEENDSKIDSNYDNNENNNADNNIDDNSSHQEEDSNNIVKIKIPAGSLPLKIGEILESNGLVKDKNEFVEKAIELKLETKLKYGEFDIAKNSSMEDILKILTK
ncbi:MAG: endolytic transglycosylase MltG [Tissierellia bacterium]|nr:endolytic transglycosylase MltG [Tissierellia bacterium]